MLINKFQKLRKVNSLTQKAKIGHFKMNRFRFRKYTIKNTLNEFTDLNPDDFEDIEHCEAYFGGTGNNMPEMIKTYLPKESKVYKYKDNLVVGKRGNDAIVLMPGVGTDERKGFKDNQISKLLGLTAKEHEERKNDFNDLLSQLGLTTKSLTMKSHSRGFIDALSIASELSDVEFDLNIVLHDPRIGFADKCLSIWGGENYGVNHEKLVTNIQKMNLIEIYNSGNIFDSFGLMIRPTLTHENVKIVETRYGHGGGEKYLLTEDSHLLDYDALDKENIYESNVVYDSINKIENSSLEDLFPIDEYPIGRTSKIWSTFQNVIEKNKQNYRNEFHKVLEEELKKETPDLSCCNKAAKKIALNAFNLMSTQMANQGILMTKEHFKLLKRAIDEKKFYLVEMLFAENEAIIQSEGHGVIYYAGKYLVHYPIYFFKKYCQQANENSDKDNESHNK